MKFICRCPIGNQSALVQILARHKGGDKPLSESSLAQVTKSLGLNAFKVHLLHPVIQLHDGYHAWHTPDAYLHVISVKYDQISVVRCPVASQIDLDSFRCAIYVFKSPQYTGGDFMFLYRFVRRRRRRSRRRRPQILVHAITFEQLFGFLSFLAQLLALTCRLPDYILVDFRRDLDLDFSRSNMEFAISQPKLVRLPRNEKQTYRLNSRAQMWPSGLTLAMTLTLNFQGQI